MSNNEEHTNREHFYYEGFHAPTTTPVPDDVFDLIAPQLSEAELRVLLYILRRTFGFKKDRDAISLSQMVNGIQKRNGQVLDKGTGLSRRGAIQGCAGLEEKGIILVEKRLTDQGDNEINVYSLRFRDAGRVGQQMPHRREPNSLGVGNEMPPQETVSQQTDLQTSKYRNGEQGENSRKLSDDQSLPSYPEQPGQPTDQNPTAPGFQTIGHVLNRRHTHPAPTVDPDREVIVEYISDFAREFGDEAKLSASVTRAVNLYRRSGVALSALTNALYTARSKTKEYAANIKKRRETTDGGFSQKGRMPYFFAILEDVLGLRAPRQPHETNAP